MANGPIDLVQEARRAETTPELLRLTTGSSLATVRTPDEGELHPGGGSATRSSRPGYNVKQLLLDLTQTEAFLYLPAKD